MKVAVCARESHINSPVDQRFGRCLYFVVVDVDSGDWEGLPNTGCHSGGGAGIQTAQLLVNAGVKAVLVDRIGPNAMEVLARAGIQVYEGISGTVSQSVEAYRQGHLKLLSQPNSPRHSRRGRS
ncbi:NifB/NifX family molybdenum-iron cluster-binding protein [Desulfofundulus thermocisternus]|uniref:NifB/NifX family molybdenum-iron cluster-binding protein n=1 Tax=Desulfofundulus thermocisternus TaxID=42471 RepID=UPI0019E42FCC|nr:NifB/NifX family molybdenum-iron cluster-binding protein [Desulfofundulus thermocisternus]MBE3584653.1 NifB/NifX family molybdenum-iron cluster-binding protein [Thermoanaerobacter sp.]MCS5694748.1 NifB/NifX family molybdenum-iron cluster-binding protein [Desulfofundulus thermocisternus]